MIARIAPVTPPYAPDIQKAFDAVMPPGTPPLLLFTTLARNPRVFQRFMAGGLLDKGSITMREREIVIDRTTARCGSEYEWGVHVAFFAAAAGLAPAEIAATVHGDAAAWTPREALLIRLVDALHDRAVVDDGLWSALKTEYSDEQLLELIVLTGFYHTVSFVANALRLPLEDGAARFAA
ncbi:MAG TPA: carboxymuconolactone decarboxylase family protein [Rhizomicrobium sp.]|jgi:alkylhydroperoxidase family enzyme|nr:carboxymuconolactone decarboxylase family protein [Rhizomicrobium sp.]